MSYCKFCESRPENDHHRIYHDNLYGYPLSDDNELFGRFILEINQAGLSWDTILKKQENFRTAFEGFDIGKIAYFNEAKISDLLMDKGIIRNRMKISAVIYNANEVLKIQEENGSFKEWLDEQKAESIEDWVKLFKRTFKFVGKDIVEEFLMSTGYLKGAHKEDCPVYERILILQPKWCQL